MVLASSMRTSRKLPWLGHTVKALVLLKLACQALALGADLGHHGLKGIALAHQSARPPRCCVSTLTE